MVWWFLAVLVGLPVLALLWLSALLVSDTFQTAASPAAAVRQLRDPQVGPIQPLRAIIGLWLALTHPR